MAEEGDTEMEPLVYRDEYSVGLEAQWLNLLFSRKVEGRDRSIQCKAYLYLEPFLVHPLAERQSNDSQPRH